MGKIPFIDNQGLAGAWTLGTVQTGEFELVARRSLPGGFGDKSVDANRHLLGDDWEQQTGDPNEVWEPWNGIGYVCGTPPCSGFSLLNTSKDKNARGPNSDINKCMWELIRYSARCRGLDGRKGPEIVSFESVQQAHKKGAPLMTALLKELRDMTGEPYELTHVLMSGSSVGSAQMRHRFFPVFHRIPFRVTNPEKREVVTYRDAIGDLEGATLQWEDQVYPHSAVSEYSQKLQRKDGKFDGHAPPSGGSAFIRLIDEVSKTGCWLPGEPLEKAVERMGKKPSTIKESKYHPDRPAKEGGILDGWSWPARTHPDKPGYVLTGSGILSFCHYSENRAFTVRELSRLMGYPDTWDWTTPSGGKPMGASMLIGKCCPVQSGQWISQHIANAIRAAYGDVDPITDRGDVVQHSEDGLEWVHNSTNLYRQWLKEDAASA